MRELDVLSLVELVFVLCGSPETLDSNGFLLLMWAASVCDGSSCAAAGLALDVLLSTGVEELMFSDAIPRSEPAISACGSGVLRDRARMDCDCGDSSRSLHMGDSEMV